MEFELKYWFFYYRKLKLVVRVHLEYISGYIRGTRDVLFQVTEMLTTSSLSFLHKVLKFRKFILTFKKLE